MPIYEQTYRRYEARGALRAVRFWPITREALRLVLARRAFLGLVALSLLPLVVRAVQVYVVTRFPEAGRVLPVDGRLFGDFLNQQIGFTLLVSIFGGSGLIANDFRTGAILVYLSRPLTRRDYVAGKLGVLLALNLAVTLVPALILYSIALGLAPDQFLVWGLWWIGPAVVLASLVIALPVSLVALAVSALSRSARVAGLALFGVIVGLEVVRQVLDSFVEGTAVRLLSLQGNMQRVCGALFGVAPGGGPHAALAALALVAAAAACLLVLRARVRAVEIVT